MAILKMAALALIISVSVLAVNVLTPLLLQHFTFKIKVKQAKEVMALARVHDARF